jgi:hypothetical protein
MHLQGNYTALMVTIQASYTDVENKKKNKNL